MEMPDFDGELAAARRQWAEADVRRRVDIDLIGGIQEVMTRNVGARLAVEHHRLMTSVSALALGAAWGARVR